VLEVRGRVIESKGYNKAFEKAESRDKGYFLLVAFSDTDLIKRGDNIKLYKELSTVDSI
jgi:hypothetical protein